MFFAPTMRRWKVTGPIVEANTSVNATGMSQAEVTSDTGRKFVIGWVVFNDGNGRGLVRLTDLLAKVWILEYIASGGDTDDPGFRSRTYRAALARDIGKLRELGLVGQTPIDPNEPVLKLDDWLAAKQREVELIDAKSQDHSK